MNFWWILYIIDWMLFIPVAFFGNFKNQRSPWKTIPLFSPALPPYSRFLGLNSASLKSIIVVIMQVHDLQGYRSQPACQVAAMIMNYWAHQTLWPKK